jgi:hypothetical protein
MTNEETLLKYITDMAGAEHHLAHTIKTQEADSDLKKFPEALRLLGKMRMTAEQHLNGLEALAKTLNGEARSSFKESVTAITGTAMGAVVHLMEHHVTKMLRDDYIVLCGNSVGYSLLHTTGLALGSEETAALALAFLKDTAVEVMELSQEVIPVAIGELSATNSIEAAATEMAQTNVREAWSSHESATR